MKFDSFQSITSSAKKFFAGTLLSRVAGMVREILMAALFGVDPAVASFLVAFRVSNFFRRFLGEGLFQSSFIPHFESLRKESELKAYSFFHSISKKVLFISLLIIGAAEIALLFFSFYENSFKEIFFLSALMLPSLLFISLFTLNSALLQCEKIYFLPSFAPTLFNLIWIVALLVSHYFFSSQAMVFLSLGILLAYFFQWLITLPQKRKILSLTSHASKFEKGELKPLGKNLAISLMGMGAYQINSLLDFLFCKIATEVGPIFLSYSSRLYQLPLALFGISFSGAILPPLSRAFQNKEEASYELFFSKTFKQVIFLSTFATLALLFFSLYSAHLIYGRGLFNADAVWSTALCLSAYGLGLLPSCLNLTLTAAFYARGNYKKPFKSAVISIFFNILFNFVTSFIFHWNAPGIALSTTLSSFINLFFLLKSFRQEIKTPWTPFFFTFLKALTLSLFAFIIASPFSLLSLEELFFLKKTTILPRDFLGGLKAFAVPFICYFAAFLIASKVLKVEEVDSFLKRRQIQKL